MNSTLQRLREETSEDSKTPFGPYEEEAIIALALDHPEFFTAVGRFLKPAMFAKLECRYIIAHILNAFEKYDIVPTRKILRDKIVDELTQDDPFDEILRIIDRPSNPREVPLVRDTLLKWAKDRAFGLIYSDEAQAAYFSGDYTYLEQVINEANRIADVGTSGFWFFDSFEMLFDPDVVEHKTTGFPKLDRVLNNGGPSPKEVVCWMAATNVGKSLVLCNNAISSLKQVGSGGELGQDVLLITFELDTIKTAMRCLGVMAEHVPLNSMLERRDYVTRVVHQIKNTYKRQLLIVEWAPEECSVSNIYALLDSLRRIHSWRPHVVIIDYMDLMVSRNAAYNKDDYTRQRHVANEIRGLAKNENVLVFTATQTNRSGMQHEDRSANSNTRSSGFVDLDKVADSFAKQFSLDYIVSINQSKSQRIATPPRFTMFVAKNRNGPKHERIECTVQYDTMVVREQP